MDELSHIVSRLLDFFNFLKSLRPSEQNQQQEEWYQRQGKKQWAAMMMDWRANHLRADVRAKLPEDIHPETISEQGERNHGQDQNRPLPRRMQKKIARD